MPTRAQTLLARLEDKARRGHRGDPVGTVAFYGPDDQRASKVVAAISPNPTAGISETQKWLGEPDLRDNADVLDEVNEFLKKHDARSIVITDGIFGCPHEEGVDYPEGEVCAQCPFWNGRQRDVPFLG
jgi:hypothetical protein